jgi:aminoglycoside 6'-N-acetyltransferase
MRVPPIPLRGELTAVRPATDADAELLVSWHDDPDVARYWDDKTFTHEQMLARLARPDVDPYIIEADGEPIGYLQAWFGKPSTDAGLDMFLVPAARGRGLGPDAARTLATYLLQEAEPNRLTVDPYLWNKPAIHAWRKAGFRPVEERPPDGDHAEGWLLMTTEVKTAE